ncbi:ABC transporter permease [Nocardia paucivorans]|uniref:ABC transporter permease n=1 Tax=Nocardia paucivorans TaxID=114259 RepID=UPI000309D532|nr:ABC transporter permease [Nocardia paucivorans]
MTFPTRQERLTGSAGGRFAIGAISTVLFVGLWYLVTEVTQLVPPLFLPPPDAVFDRLVQFLTSPYQGNTFGGHLLASVGIVVTGWLVGAVIGIPVGIAMGAFRTFELIARPIFNVIRPIPPIAWIPLAILWFGLGDLARVYVVTLAAVVPWILNSYEAVSGTDRVLIHASHTLGAGTWRTLWAVVLPTSMPTVVTGARLALGNAWMTVVAAELLGATEGLGYVALNARSTLDIDIMVAAMLLIGLVGVVLSEGIRIAEKRLIRWSVTT